MANPIMDSQTVIILRVMNTSTRSRMLAPSARLTAGKLTPRLSDSKLGISIINFPLGGVLLPHPKPLSTSGEGLKVPLQELAQAGDLCRHVTHLAQQVLDAGVHCVEERARLQADPEDHDDDGNQHYDLRP